MLARVDAALSRRLRFSQVEPARAALEVQVGKTLEMLYRCKDPCTGLNVWPHTPFPRPRPRSTVTSHANPVNCR